MKKQQKLRKNTLYKARSKEKTAWVGVVFTLLLMVFLVGTVTAFEFDNVKNYDEETKTVDIRNSVLGIDFLQLGKVAEVKLTTPREIIINNIDQHIAEFEINNFKEYDNFLNKVESFKEVDGGEEFDFDYKYKYFNDKVGTHTKSFVQELQYKNGTRYDVVSFKEVAGSWVDFDEKAELPIGIIKVRMYFNQQVPNYVIEVIPTFFGVRVNEWFVVEIKQKWDTNGNSAHTIDADYRRAQSFTPQSEQELIIVGVNISSANSEGTLWGFISNTTDGTSAGTCDGTIRGHFTNVTQGTINAYAWYNMTFSDNNVTLANNQTYCIHIYGTATSPNQYNWKRDDDATYTYGSAQFAATADHVWGFEGSRDMEFRTWALVPSDPVPTVNNNIPTNLSTLTSNSVVFSGNASDDSAIINVSLYIDNVLNQTNSSGFNATQYNFTVALTEGTYDWFYSAWDDASPPQNTNGTGMRFTVSTAPTINVFSPLNGTNQTNSTVLFMATSSLAVDNWIVNYNGTNHTLSAINTSLEVEDGNHALLLYADNSATGIFGLNDTTTSFIVHTQTPQVRIHYPNHTFNSLTNGETLTLNWTPYDTINLTRHITNCTYRYDNALTILNNTACTIFNTTTFTYITNVNYLNFTITDEYGLATTNSTAWSANFIATDELYNSSDVLETDEESFFVNLTTGLTIESISAFLNYNGTKHSSTASCTSGLCQLSNTIDLNTIVSAASAFENKTFFWEVNIFNGTSNNNFNTTNAEQNVSKIQFGNCGSDSTYNKTLNFTFYNETDNTPLGVSAEFDGSFTYYLGSGDVTKTNQTTATNNTVEFCIDPPEQYIVTSEIELEEVGFSTRRFDFIIETYNTTQTNKSLYLVNGTDTNVIVQVKDAGLGILANILVEVERFFPDTNTYTLVESQLTDDFGQIVAHLIENDVRYRFNFTTGSRTLKSSPDVAVACKSSICILPFVIEEEITEFDDFTALGSYTSTLSFDNSTNTFTVSWDDKRGEASTFRLKVERYQLNGTSSVCNTTSTSQLSTLSCAVGDQRASYVAQFYRKPSLGSDAGEERRMIVLNSKVGDPSSTFGVEGLLWAFILLFTAVAIGSFNPTVGVGLFGFGFVMLGLMGIIAMPIEVFFGVVVLCVLFVWLVRS